MPISIVGGAFHNSYTRLSARLEAKNALVQERLGLGKKFKLAALTNGVKTVVPARLVNGVGRILNGSKNDDKSWTNPMDDSTMDEQLLSEPDEEQAPEQPGGTQSKAPEEVLPADRLWVQAMLVAINVKIDEAVKEAKTQGAEPALQAEGRRIQIGESDLHEMQETLRKLEKTVKQHWPSAVAT